MMLLITLINSMKLIVKFKFYSTTTQLLHEHQVIHRSYMFTLNLFAI